VKRLGVAAALVLALWTGPAGATRDPPTYRASLAAQAAADAEALNGQQRFEDARKLCQRFTRAFGPAAPVLYEEAFAWNLEGKLDKALDVYGRAIEQDPELATARYDRAEILLARGDLDAAEADLQVVARLRPDHWAVHLRLAEIAGRRGDTRALETELLDTIRSGMDWGVLLGDPTWEELAADDTAGPVLQRLLNVYGDPAIYEHLRNPAPR